MAKETDTWKEILSFECRVSGIAFYHGREKMESLSRLKFRREADNAFDSNAIAVYVANEQLGYVESSVAAVLAQVVDCFEDNILMMG